MNKDFGLTGIKVKNDAVDDTILERCVFMLQIPQPAFTDIARVDFVRAMNLGVTAS